jgi:putative Mg2+ transporter-C (MgtC) family protein
LEAARADRTDTRVNLPFIEAGNVVASLASLLVAYALALPVAWEREQSERSAGLRTFPLVAVASCGYVLIASKTLGHHPEAQARVLEGLITGMGFIGGGAILKGGGSVTGTATAASLWNTGAIGAAVAFGRHEIALILSVLNFATLRWMLPLKAHIRKEDE